MGGGGVFGGGVFGGGVFGGAVALPCDCAEAGGLVGGGVFFLAVDAAGSFLDGGGLKGAPWEPPALGGKKREGAGMRKVDMKSPNTMINLNHIHNHTWAPTK